LALKWTKATLTLPRQESMRLWMVKVNHKNKIANKAFESLEKAYKDWYEYYMYLPMGRERDDAAKVYEKLRVIVRPLIFEVLEEMKKKYS